MKDHGRKEIGEVSVFCSMEAPSLMDLSMFRVDLLDWKVSHFLVCGQAFQGQRAESVDVPGWISGVGRDR